MEQTENEIKKYEKYQKMVFEQEIEVIRLLEDIRRFQWKVDFPLFNFVEDELINLQIKLKQVEKNPTKFVREFDEEDWDE